MLADEYDEVIRFPRWLRPALLCVMLLACGECNRMAFGQIKLQPEYSVGQPVIVEVAWPDAPEGSVITDLQWSAPGAGLQIIGDNTAALWPEFSAADKQLTVTASGLLTTSDGKYVPKSNRTFTATTLLRGIVGPGPKPPPEPGPKPPPVPSDEAPIKEPGFRVLITYESQQPVPRWLNDADFRKMLTDYCIAGPNGTKEWRIVDPDSPTVANAGVWPGALEKMKGKPVPGILISNGRIGTIQKLPETKEAAMALIKQYAEAK